MIKKTGAELVRYALEQLGIRYTFGIPGVHNTEIYDQLANSPVVTPVRVTHEGCGAFMADAVSRTNDFNGALLIVPAAGTALAMAGIGEAFLDGIPMLVISGGTRTDTGHTYQLHEMDQLAMVKPITKGAWRVSAHQQIVPVLFEAWLLANSGEPGPVFVEIPLNLQMLAGAVPVLPVFARPQSARLPSDAAMMAAVQRAAAMLSRARKPGLFLGWGAVHASDLSVALAEALQAPVATTLQGLSAFPGQHPLHAGMGIGPAAVPAAENAFADCDVLLAVGTRFGEIATGSFGIRPTWQLIHADINPAVFNANYPAQVCLEGDARAVLQALLNAVLALQTKGGGAGHEGLEGHEHTEASGLEGACLDDLAAKRGLQVRAQIHRDKQASLDEWLRHDSGGRVNPARFFQSLRQHLPDDAYMATDDGNHTFLVAELFESRLSRHLITPTDFNCMGYGVPATIGVQLTHPQQQVVGIIGDGAFLMTGLEILTASELGLGAVFYVFNDGELSQISQTQQLSFNRKACTVLPEVRIKGIADAVGAHYLCMAVDADIDQVIQQAQALAARHRPVVVDVRVDYSKATRFTKGILRTNFDRMDLGTKCRMVGRAVWRRVVGVKAR